MKPNNFAMRDWHLEHIEKVITRYIKGISPDASSFEKRNFKKYSTISSCAKQIEYDIKHGVTTEQVIAVMERIRHDSSFADMRANPDCIQRLDDLERQLFTSRKVASW
jgi:murein L,D-transpeptidase YcbB/YkuD